ncbi:sensor histidine kinase [Lachnospira multipara]|uniref:sensor histidine kinase n=1 Tax=Lachnospira multipara TaxID=28051 RepID=UPI00055114CE|nr:HAMP domain-containing sensor histidine kinase [Lachnospira multipara]
MENRYYKMVDGYRVRKSHFPIGMVFYVFLAFIGMSALQFAVIIGVEALEWDWWLVVVFVFAYWLLVAIVFTVFTRLQVKNAYEKPLKEIANAINQVANGDFSVYVPTIHTPEKLDYLDIMIVDFNKMVEELGSIETLKTDFFSNVSHEIKTPISVIQNTSELLKKSDLKEEDKAQVDIIYNASKKLSALISNILRLNRLEKQKIKAQLKEFDLSRQLCDCVLLFEDQWDKKNIELDLDIEDSVYIDSDEELLDHVWTNIISNAIKFTKDGGKISIKEESFEDKVNVTISDNGEGMSEETIRHIFDKFYQGDASHATEGNGLGLALVSRILQLVDGEISVDSKLSEGTSICVSLPKTKN